jgi:hypothetical protein
MDECLITVGSHVLHSLDFIKTLLTALLIVMVFPGY